MKLLLLSVVLAICARGAEPKLEVTTTNTPYVFDTSTSGAAPANFYSVVWKDNGERIVSMRLATNVVTEWTTVREEWCLTPAQLTVYCTDAHYQVGSLVTNQVVEVVAYGKTNQLVLKCFGRDEWPSQKRVMQLPAAHRPF